MNGPSLLLFLFGDKDGFWEGVEDALEVVFLLLDEELLFVGYFEVVRLVAAHQTHDTQ